MTIAWEWKSLSRETQDWGRRINSLLEVGFGCNEINLSKPHTLAIELSGLSATDVVAKIKGTEIFHNEPLVRTIVDEKLGAAHHPDEPLGSGNEGVLTLTTHQPQRAIDALRRTPGVAAVLAA